MQLAGSVAVVTGGASGLGLATARLLGSRGAVVAVLDRQQALDPSRALALELDVGDPVAVDHAMDEVAATLGPPRIVVCCAGIGGFARMARRSGGNHPLELWDRILRVNLTGTFLVCNAAVRHLTSAAPLDASGTRGVFVLTSSIAGLDGPTGGVAYAASKAAVAAMAEPMARDLGDLGIRVVSIAPGTFDTPLLAGMSSSAVEAMVATKPFPRRPGVPAEFAATVQFIVENDMLNGCTLRLDGGERLT